jgi:hypothetical protein
MWRAEGGGDDEGGITASGAGKDRGEAGAEEEEVESEEVVRWRRSGLLPIFLRGRSNAADEFSITGSSCCCCCRRACIGVIPFPFHLLLPVPRPSPLAPDASMSAEYDRLT